MKVVLSPTARLQLTTLADWWDAYRPDARTRVEDALGSAVAAMAEHPRAGPVYSRDPRYRTWRLKGTPYFLIYRVDEAVDAVVVVVAWSARRGVGPQLP